MSFANLKHLRALAPVIALCAACACLSSVAFAAGVHIEGRLREKGTRKPLKDVHVFAIPEAPLADANGAPAGANTNAVQPIAPSKPLKATTDAQGRFVFDDLPTGKFKWIVNQSGYNRLELKDEQPADAPLPYPPRELYLEKASYLGAYETTIYDKAQKRDDKTKSITGDDISKLAGASNDPIKAVQNLPGVNRSSGFSAQVIIEGSSPNDTVYLIDGQEVPNIFHFGGLTTVVPPESVDRVDLLTSGFGVEYGRTTAGLVSVWLKNPRTDRLHGEVYADLYNFGIMAEGPIGDHSSFFLGVRQSYIGPLLKLALAGNSNFDLTVAPDFGDVTGIYETELTPIDTFKLVEVGSLDTLNFIFNEPVSSNPSLRGSFSELTSFFRLTPEFTHHNSQVTTTRLSLGLGKDWIRVDTGDNYLHVTDWAFTSRFEVEHEYSSTWKAQWGLDNAVYWSYTEFEFPKLYSSGGVSTPFSVAQTLSANVTQSYTQLGAYWRNEIHVGDTPWTVLPGVRLEYYNLTSQLVPEPRLQLRYRVNDSLTLRSASGLYAIAPQPQETSPVYGNPNLKMPLSVHFTAGAEEDFRHGSSNGWDVVADLFYKHFYDLVIPSSAQVPQANGTLAPENYNNNGHGRAFGLEAQAKYNYGDLSGWLTYTLSRSTRWDPVNPEAVSSYDQTHNLAAIGSWQAGHNWQISARFRYVTGDPRTPIVGAVLDADNDVYVPIAGSYYSQRISPFWQLDLRFDKKWIYDKWILSAYLDIQNATNHTNVEAIRYSYDYSQTTTISDLPFLPILGMKGEF